MRQLSFSLSYHIHVNTIMQTTPAKHTETCFPRKSVSFKTIFTLEWSHTVTKALGESRTSKHIQRRIHTQQLLSKWLLQVWVQPHQWYQSMLLHRCLLWDTGELYYIHKYTDRLLTHTHNSASCHSKDNRPAAPDTQSGLRATVCIYRGCVHALLLFVLYSASEWVVKAKCGHSTKLLEIKAGRHQKAVFSLQLVIFVDGPALGLRVVNVYILRKRQAICFIFPVANKFHDWNQQLLVCLLVILWTVCSTKPELIHSSWRHKSLKMFHKGLTQGKLRMTMSVCHKIWCKHSWSPTDGVYWLTHLLLH